MNCTYGLTIFVDIKKRLKRKYEAGTAAGGGFDPVLTAAGKSMHTFPVECAITFANSRYSQWISVKNYKHSIERKFMYVQKKGDAFHLLFMG